MKSRKHLLVLLCLVSACSALPSMAMAGVNVVIGVAPPVHYYGPRGYIAAPGYWQWQSPRRVWVPERRHYPGGYYEREASRWHGGQHFGSRSHWNDRGWDRRGEHEDRDHHERGHHGHDR